MGDLLEPTHLIVLLVVFGFFVLPFIFYILSLQRALEKCAPSSRTLSSGSLWVLLIPVANVIFHFIVVAGMARSLGNEFRRRNAVNIESAPGQSIGLAMCICMICGIIPILGIFASIAGFVLWIIYWVTIVDYSRMLGERPGPVFPGPGY